MDIFVLTTFCYDPTICSRRGLYEALDFFDKPEGVIVTLSQKDRFEEKGKIIYVVPAHEFMA